MSSTLDYSNVRDTSKFHPWSRDKSIIPPQRTCINMFIADKLTKVSGVTWHSRSPMNFMIPADDDVLRVIPCATGHYFEVISTARRISIIQDSWLIDFPQDHATIVKDYIDKDGVHVKEESYGLWSDDPASEARKAQIADVVSPWMDAACAAAIEEFGDVLICSYMEDYAMEVSNA